LQEPADLTIPHGVKTAACHQPIAAVRYKIEVTLSKFLQIKLCLVASLKNVINTVLLLQRHAWGEGRLPILPQLCDVKSVGDEIACP
jgi:hypothetical protein